MNGGTPEHLAILDVSISMRLKWCLSIWGGHWRSYAHVFCWLWAIKKFRDIFDVVMQTKLVAVLMFNGYVSFIEFYWYSIQRKCELDFMLGCGFPTWSFKVKILQKNRKEKKNWITLARWRVLSDLRWRNSVNDNAGRYLR